MDKSNHFFRLMLLAVIFTLALSCNFNLKYKIGSGNMVTEEISVEPFSSLILGGNYKVLLEASEKPAVVIRTDDNLIKYIRVEVREGELYIGNIHNLKGSEGIHINIFYQELGRLVSTGSSSVRNKGTLNPEKFELDMSGSGAFEGSLNVHDFELNISGAGLVETNGFAENQVINISGAGGYQGFELQSMNSTITLSGVGGARIYASDKLVATITGLGGIVYRGEPKKIERRITGMGQIKRDSE